MSIQIYNHSGMGILSLTLAEDGFYYDPRHPKIPFRRVVKEYPRHHVEYIATKGGRGLPVRTQQVQQGYRGRCYKDEPCEIGCEEGECDCDCTCRWCN
jgi:hypothetical protein